MQELVVGGVWKKFRELSGVLVRKQRLFSKQLGNIYQCFVRPVFLYRCEMWDLTVVGETRLCGLEHHMIRMMCVVKLVDRVSNDVLRDRVGVVVKIEDMIIQSFLQWYGHIMHGDINS